MPALTQRDVTILQSYATNGQRERYWSYLAALGDKYAVRALEVVQNSSVFGQLANNHAAAFVPATLQSTFNEVGWNEFGKDLMRADLVARMNLFSEGNGTGDKGLTLTGKTIRDYHAAVFETNGIPRQAWTLEGSLGVLYDSGNAIKIAQANGIWSNAIGSTSQYLLAVAESRTAILLNQSLPAAVIDSVKNAYYLVGKYDQFGALRNPDNIRGWIFDAVTGTWGKESATGGSSGVPIQISPTPAEALMLNADRQYRLQRLNDPTRFQRHPDDTLTPAITRDNPRPLATLDTTDPFNPNPTTLAAALAEDAAGSFYSAQASAGGGTYAGVPATVTQAVAAELAGYDLATADTFKENGIVYIQFANGDQFAINGLGAIANTKTTAVSGGLQTIATDFDGTSVNLNQSSDGTNSVVAKDAQGLSTASFTASANQSNVTSYSAPGQVANVLTTLATASGYQSELIDAQGTVLQTTQMHAYDDGSSLATTTYPSGASTTLTTAPDNTSHQLDTPAPNSGQDPNTLAITLRDAAGAITATGSRTVNPIDGSFEEALLGSATPGQPNGTLSASSVSATGEVSPKLDKTALDNLNQNAQYFNDSYSLINAIKNRQPLPILTSGIHVYNNITHDAPPMLLNAASALGAASSVYGLLQALQKGDVPQALVAGASAFTQGVTAYVNIAYGGDAILAASEGLGNVIGAASAVSQVLPFLGIANDLANRGGREVILDMPAIRRIKNHSYKRRYRETQTVRKLCKHRTHDFKRQFIPNIGMKNHTFKLRYSNASATNDFAWKVAV